MKVTFYQRTIMETLGCSHERARVVEDAMRDLSPTRCLDHFDKAAFRRLAREAEQIVCVLEAAGEASYGPY